MAVGVVQLLEMIEIEHDEGQAAVVALLTSERLRQVVGKRAPIVEPREWIAHGLLANFFGELDAGEKGGRLIGENPEHPFGRGAEDAAVGRNDERTQRAIRRA